MSLASLTMQTTSELRCSVRPSTWSKMLASVLRTLANLSLSCARRAQAHARVRQREKNISPRGERVSRAVSRLSCVPGVNFEITQRNDGGKTPLWRALHQEVRLRSLPERDQYGLRLRHVLDIVRVLLRHGALLDCGPEDSATYSAEEKFFTFKYVYHETAKAIKALIVGVRQHGTYKRYMRAPHREFLALRGLAQRGKLSTEHRALNFIAKLGERGVVWHILTYWRPTE